MEDTRQRYLTRFAEQQGRQGLFPTPQEGDLVLLRRAALDNRYDKKLEAHWEGPFRLGNIAHHGRSGRLYDITTGALVKTKPSGLKDRIHLDDLRIYVPRAGEGAVGMECATMCWKGEGASAWEKVGVGGEVDLNVLISEEDFLCRLEGRGGPRLRENGDR